jgi:molecular chaperone DnaK (HSP70)
MSNQETKVFGIDLGTTYSCIAHVDEYGKPEVITNEEGERTTPSVILFESPDNIVVGKVAKESAVLSPDRVVAMVKRHMGEENWEFECDGLHYTPEEISSYILRKLAKDTEEKLGIPVKDVVITCPAYFGIAEREATANAGKIAGLNVREVINEPTAAAIVYGLQNEKDQVVLVYDLGGGTFDITVIEIKSGTITVIATGGDHNLGGKDWDAIIVQYLAEQWMMETGSSDDPTSSEETLQDLWLRAESAKRTLSSKQETSVPVTHAGQRKGITLTREKFNELTASLLERTIDFTKTTMEEARKRGFSHFDQILLVGGSTRMPQVQERLKEDFSIPTKVHDPDESVAKGAAIYAHKLMLDEKIQHKIAEITGTDVAKVDSSSVSERVLEQAQQQVAQDVGLKLGTIKKFNEMEVTNVASHSFGIIAVDSRKNAEVIFNLVRVNDPLPAISRQTFFTLEAEQEMVDIRIMENSFSTHTVDDIEAGEKIGEAELHLPPRLPINAPIEVTFDLNREGRLHVTAREPGSNMSIEVTIQTKRGLSEEAVEKAKKRSTHVAIS